MRKIIFIISLLLVAIDICSIQTLNAATSDASTVTNSTSAAPSYYQRNKSYPHTDIEIVIATEETKSQETPKSKFKHDGTFTKGDLSLVHSFNKNDDIRFFVASEFQTFNEPSQTRDGVDQKFDWDLTEFMYRRNNILTESKSGIDLQLELKNYYFISHEKRQLYGYDGAFIPQLIFKKHFTRRFTTELKLRHHFYFKNNGRDSTSTGLHRIYLTPGYAFTRRLFTNIQFKYEHRIKKNKYFSGRTRQFEPKETDRLVAHPAVMYLLNESALLEGYIESEIMKSHDGRTLHQDWTNHYVIGAAAYITAF